MEHLYTSNIGLLHLIASCFALLFGTIILIMRKGTKRHKQIGYAYVVSMVILLVTSFMTYRLFGGWGIFHYTAVVSTIILLGGMLPAIFKKPIDTWKVWHFSFMYWSVIGLYCAFAAETLVRVPSAPFFGAVGIATAIVATVGGVVFGFKKSIWEEEFNSKS